MATVLKFAPPDDTASSMKDFLEKIRTDYFTNQKYKHLYNILVKLKYDDLDQIKKEWCLIYTNEPLNNMNKIHCFFASGFDKKEDMLSHINELYQNHLYVAYVIHDTQLQQFKINVSLELI